MRKRCEQASAAYVAALAISCTACAVAGTDAAPSHSNADASPGATTAPHAPIDFTALDRLIGDARFVVFGEDSHRMPAVHQLVNAMFRHLVEAKGFRTFVFESYWGIEEVLGGFLASDRPTPNTQETFFLNAFTSEPITELLLWVRAYNRAHPDDPVRFTGYHPDQPVTDAAALRAFGERAPALERSSLEAALAGCGLDAGKYADDVALLTALGARRQNKQPGYTVAARAACRQGLDALARAINRTRAELEGQTSRGAVKEAELHVSGIRFFVDESSPAADRIAANWLGGAPTDVPDQGVSDLYLKADKMRFDIFEALQETRPHSGKTFLWMHNWHAARHSQTIELVHSGRRGRAVSIGERLSERYGDHLVSIANIVPCENCGEPAGSLEPAFARRFDGRAAVVNLSDPKSAGLPIHSPGILFAQYHKPVTAWLENVVLDRHFDGVIYLPNAQTLP